MEQHHTHACAARLSSLWEMPPTQRSPDDQGGWAGQPGSLYTGGPGGQPGKAAFPEAGLGVCCSDGHD